MAPSLIERLNALQSLSPDQIAAKLSSKNWIEGGDVTAELHRKWGNREILICTPDKKLIEHSTFYASHFNLDGYNVTLRRYWFILKENFHGELPDRAP